MTWSYPASASRANDQRVASSALLGLQHKINSRVGHRGPHPICLVTDDGVDVAEQEQPSLPRESRARAGAFLRLHVIL